MQCMIFIVLISKVSGYDENAKMKNKMKKKSVFE